VVKALLFRLRKETWTFFELEILARNRHLPRRNQAQDIVGLLLQRCCRNSDSSDRIWLDKSKELGSNKIEVHPFFLGIQQPGLRASGGSRDRRCTQDADAKPPRSLPSILGGFLFEGTIRLTQSRVLWVKTGVLTDHCLLLFLATFERHHYGARILSRETVSHILARSAHRFLTGQT
jgi:hypothetical protein